MTLQDLWLLLKRYAKWVITVPLLCALLAGGGMLVLDKVKGETYKVTATLTVTDLTGIISAGSLSNLVGAIAQDQADNASTDALKVTVTPNASTQSFAFSVEGDDERAAVDTANTLAEDTVELSKTALVAQGEAFLELAGSASSSVDVESISVDPMASPADRLAALQSCVFTITEANEGTMKDSGAMKFVKYAVVGLVGGLFFVVCALALIDSVRRPIKHEGDIRELTDLPVLAKSSSRGFADRLWTNAQFVAERPIGGLCILPVSDSASEAFSGDLFSGVTEHVSRVANGVSAAIYPPLSRDMSGAVAAHTAPATIVVVRVWADTASGFCETLRELEIAKAHVIGVVLVY